MYTLNMWVTEEEDQTHKCGKTLLGLQLPFHVDQLVSAFSWPKRESPEPPAYL